MAGDDEIKLDPNKLLQEFAVESRNALSAISTVTATLENVRASMDEFKEDFKELHATIKGNGGGFKEGLEFKVYELQKLESECEGRKIKEVKEEILEEVKSIRTELVALQNILLLKKGEKLGAQEQKKKQEEAETLQKKEGKRIRDMLGNFISAKPIQSALVVLVGGCIISLGTCMGVIPKKAHDKAVDSGQSSVPATQLPVTADTETE
jgi:hypothetical protein